MRKCKEENKTEKDGEGFIHNYLPCQYLLGTSDMPNKWGHKGDKEW